MPPANSPTSPRPQADVGLIASPSLPPTSAHGDDGALHPLITLSHLSSSVVDLAATLHDPESTAASLHDRRHADRRSLSHLVEQPQQSSRQASDSLTAMDPPTDPASHTANYADRLDDLTRQERLQRVLARLYRMSDAANTAPPSATAYSNRTPSPRRQSLYDWAPSQHGQMPNSIGASGASNDTDQHHTGESQSVGRSRDAAHRMSVARDTQRLERAREQRRDSAQQSLRSRVLSQRYGERSTPAAPRQTERGLRFAEDERDRSELSEEEIRARIWIREHIARGEIEEQAQRNTAQTAVHRETWLSPPTRNASAAQAARIESSLTRRLGVETMLLTSRASIPLIPTPSVPSSPPNSLLERSLRYLADLRDCDTYEDSLAAAFRHDLYSKEFFAEKHDDFIMDVREIRSVTDSSWLQPGTVFCGRQHASPGVSSTILRASTTLASGVNSTGTPYQSSVSRQIPEWSRPLGRVPNKSFGTSPDQWPVRVIVHAVDHERMRIQGTMEAYDVPQNGASTNSSSALCTGGGADPRPKAGKKSAPIKTYLEGHIIDLRQHSFLTPCSAQSRHRSEPHTTAPGNATPYTTYLDDVVFPAASAQIDAANWRKLPPFSDDPLSTGEGSLCFSATTEEAMARLLLSKARMQALHEEYIFMRWKERCFVHAYGERCADTVHSTSDQDRGHGLTISGFYYVSLRRSDGMVDGLYFDPSSTPYQHLHLEGVRTGWPAFEFR